SKVAINGDVRDLHWLTGLNAPKGMTLIGDLLYVTDINQLVIIDITNQNKTIIPVANAVFLGDITHDASGVVYVSDMLTDTIYSFSNNTVAVWLHDKKLKSPNGLHCGDGFLYVGCFGRVADESSAMIDGDLLRIQLETKQVTIVASRLGNINGVERYGDFFILTDHGAGTLILMDKMGHVQEMRTIGPGAADLCVLPEDWELLVVPMMQDNLLVGFTVKYSL
ncbi:MAG: hypothetical protein PF495_10990, partial [Spirochaetales bacterium]|nr:hypothetical protein [Spirochaetales bacterium]